MSNNQLKKEEFEFTLNKITMKKDIEDPKFHMSVPEDYFKNINKRIRIKIDNDSLENKKENKTLKINFSSWIQVAASIITVCFFSWLLTDMPSKQQNIKTSFAKVQINDPNKLYAEDNTEEEYLLFLNDLIADQEPEIWFVDN